MPCGISVANYVPLTNIKPFLMAFDTVYALFMNCINETMVHNFKIEDVDHTLFYDCFLSLKRR